MSTARTKSRRRISRARAVQQYESARRVLATDAPVHTPNQSEEDTVEATSKSSNTREQYRDIVKFLIARPDEVVDANDYLNWSERDASLEFTSTKQVHDRFYQLGLAVLPIQHKRKGGLYEEDLVATLAVGGAFYRVGDNNRSGQWVYDTSASFGGYRGRVSLKGNTLDHNPTSVVQAHLIPSQGGPAWPSEALDAQRDAEAARIRDAIAAEDEALAVAKAKAEALLAEEERQVAEAQQRERDEVVRAEISRVERAAVAAAINGHGSEVLSTPGGAPLNYLSVPEWEVIGADAQVQGTVVLRSSGGTVLVAEVTSIVG